MFIVLEEEEATMAMPESQPQHLKNDGFDSFCTQKVDVATTVRCAGPEAGGGPPPPSSPPLQDRDDIPADLGQVTSETDIEHSSSGSEFPERSPSGAMAEVLFESLAHEPYETVFADPSTFTRSSMPPAAPSIQPQSVLAALGKEQHFIIRNLDTGEFRRLGENALNKSFVGEYEKPSKLVGNGNRKAKNAAWASWWADKRVKDERLWLAAESGSSDLLRESLEGSTDGSAPCEVNSKSLYGRTALHIAVSVGRPDCIELLLDAGADLEARTDAGLTALHVACQRGHPCAATLLLDWGAESRVETKDHSLPIHLAAANGHAEIVSILLDRGNVPEQLSSRNSMGQRAAEVSLDIATSEIFKLHESRLSIASSDEKSDNSPGVDHYAGRTPYHKGSVLLHNARSDVISRLLHKTQNHPSAQGVVAASPEDAIVRARSRKNSLKSCSEDANAKRKPFAQIRSDARVEKVGPDSFVLVERLGKGSFGEVFQVRHKGNEQTYAMKILRKSRIMSGNLLRYAVTERNVLSYINHPYIVSLHFAFQTSSYLVLVLQYCPGGNLQHLIEAQKRLQEPLAKLYSAEVLLALAHLHERQIVFRDLKPDNIVLDEDHHAVLTDFGLSKEGVLHLQGTRSFCGSVAFLAPEILQRRGHGHTVDVYGLGVLLFDMLTGLPPFYHPDRETLFQNIKHARLQIPRYVPKPAQALIEALMEREPSKRLGAVRTADVKDHHFFASIDFEAVMRREVEVPSARSRNLRSASPRTPMYRGARPENPFTAGPESNRRGGASPQDVSGWSFATP